MWIQNRLLLGAVCSGSTLFASILNLSVMLVVGLICNNFEKNRAFYDKSIKLGTGLVDYKTKKLRVSATPKMSSYGRHLAFPKWPPFSTYLF